MDCFFNPSYNSESFLNDPGFLSFRSRSFSSRTTDFRLNKSELEKQFGPFDALGDFNLQTHMKSRPKIASSNEGSSVSQNCSNLRKRKSVSKGKSQKVVEDDHDDRDSKRFKTIKNKGIENDEKRNEKQNDENKKAPEPPKDYIHVRARRGEATDSHSLAERVQNCSTREDRRKMKILQDLVPGCNKVTGKALMLDEIINYVQSLQCQVEYLSVKLASVDPLKINTDSVLPKDVTNSIHSLDSSFQAKTDFSTHCSLDHSDTTRSTLFRDISFQLPLVDNFGQGFPQFSGSYEDDLQSIVQMGFKQNPSNNLEFHSQSFPGSSDTTT